LIEHETDHVYCGNWTGTPKINPNEAAGYKWIEMYELEKDFHKTILIG
jgi:isopentenyl-diphosphate Delta-isomerase